MSSTYIFGNQPDYDSTYGCWTFNKKVTTFYKLPLLNAVTVNKTVNSGMQYKALLFTSDSNIRKLWSLFITADRESFTFPSGLFS